MSSTQSTPQTFPQFPLLPIELRFHIYILATQPRFIHICEVPSEGYDDFQQRFASEPPPNTLKLHPSLAYFSHGWRHTIPHKRTAEYGNLVNYIPPSTHHQTILTSHNFTTTKPRYQPWPPTATCPEIPLHTLHERPDIVWVLTRDSYLCSSAPIPHFLHVSRESRSCLKNYGYELAFSTRTQGPRTWICWKDDIVYLERPDDTGGSLLLTREPWGFGVFMPSDLQKMRRVALEGFYFATGGTEKVSKILRLCKGLEELFIVEANLDDLLEEAEEYMSRRDYGIQVTEEQLRAVRVDEECVEGRYWGWVECDEADVLNGEQWPSYWHRLRLECVGYNRWDGHDCYMLINYKRKHGGNGNGFFADVCKGFERDLRNEMGKIVCREEVAPWNIPSTKLVLVGTMGRMKKLFKMREKYWRAVEEKQLKELEGGVPFAERVPVQRPLSPYSLAWQDDIEAYEDTISYY